LAKILVDNQIDLVFTSGQRMQWLRDSLPVEIRGEHNDDPAKLAEIIKERAQPGDVFMIKGSRGQYNRHGRMHVVVEALLSLAEQSSAVAG